MAGRGEGVLLHRLLLLLPEELPVLVVGRVIPSGLLGDLVVIVGVTLIGSLELDPVLGKFRNERPLCAGN